MLVLTRRIGEAIVIDGDIRVTVLAVKGPRVRLGIAAPLSVHLARLEVLEEQLPLPAEPVNGESPQAGNGRAARMPVNGDRQAARRSPRLRRTHERRPS